MTATGVDLSQCYSEGPRPGFLKGILELHNPFPPPPHLLFPFPSCLSLTLSLPTFPQSFLFSILSLLHNFSILLLPPFSRLPYTPLPSLSPSRGPTLNPVRGLYLECCKLTQLVRSFPHASYFTRVQYVVHPIAIQFLRGSGPQDHSRIDVYVDSHTHLHYSIRLINRISVGDRGVVRKGASPQNSPPMPTVSLCFVRVFHFVRWLNPDPDKYRSELEKAVVVS